MLCPQSLTKSENLQHLYSVYFLYWYKSTNTDAAQDRCDSTISSLDHTRIGWGYFGGGIAAGLLLAALIAGVVYILENMKKKKGDEEAGELGGVTGGQLDTLRMARAARAPVSARLHLDTQFSSPPSRSMGSAGSVGSPDAARAPLWARLHPGTQFSSPPSCSTVSAGSVGSLDVKK